MKVLTATRTTQGCEDSDKFTATEGELVFPEHCPDCRDSESLFRGAESSGITTTAVVTERCDLTHELLLEVAVRAYFEHLDLSPDALAHYRELLETEVTELAEIVDEFPPGFIVRRDEEALYFDDPREAVTEWLRDRLAG